MSGLGGGIFHVVTTEGSFHSEWYALDVAKRRADQANVDAEKLGIATRYEVRELLAEPETERS